MRPARGVHVRESFSQDRKHDCGDQSNASVRDRRRRERVERIRGQRSTLWGRSSRIRLEHHDDEKSAVVGCVTGGKLRTQIQSGLLRTL